LDWGFGLKCESDSCCAVTVEFVGGFKLDDFHPHGRWRLGNGRLVGESDVDDGFGVGAGHGGSGWAGAGGGGWVFIGFEVAVGEGSRRLAKGRDGWRRVAAFRGLRRVARGYKREEGCETGKKQKWTTLTNTLGRSSTSGGKKIRHLGF
jgi:hypothetical protein